MNRPLEHDQTREATSSIRGYVYQAYQSVLAWMRLKEEDVLYLEAAEDFDIHEIDSVIVTGIKDTAGSGSITLRSSDVVEAINNYWRHKQLNPDRTIRFRFLTTAKPGQEKGTTFGVVGKGIDYWTLAARNEQVAVEPIKAFLLDLALDEPLKAFLRTCDDRSLRRDLILGIQWDTGSKPKDGLIADIEERLINHGDRKSIDSYHSQKALDTLLRRIADLLSSQGNRRLTYAEFCVAFDKATMELMPKGEAAALRSITSQLHPLAKTSILTALQQAPRILDKPLPLVQGAVPRDELVAKYAAILRHHGAIILRGSTGLGKTSLARMVTDQLGGEWAWACFRGREPAQIADLLSRAAFEIKTHELTSQIVLDDLDIGAVAKFERELLALVFSIVNIGGFVVITGPSLCPPDLLNKLWLPPECDQAVPYLNERDVAAIAMLHGLEDNQKLQKWSNVIWLTTQGHPQLVHARIRNLQSKNWPPVEDMTWLQREDLQPEMDASRRRLSGEIPSDGARSLAYRLSLIVEHFSRKTALNLAQLPPPISFAGESFDLLVGPWIEKIGEDSYRVSPLLLHQGKEVLTLVETNAVHEKIALEILGRKSLSPSDVGTVLSHALIARSTQALIQITHAIMTAKSEAWRAIGDTVFWFSAIALEPGQQIFGENLFIDFMLRLSQFRVAAANKQIDKAHAIMDRTCEILAMQKEEVAIANTAMAYLTFLLAIEIPIPPRRSVAMLSRLIDISKTKDDFGDMLRQFLDKDTLSLSSGLTPAQTLFTFEAARITGLKDLKELLEALNDLESEKRSYLLAAIETSDVVGADLLVVSAWWGDASRDQLDIGKAISILRFAVEVGQTRQAPKLVRAAYVAMSVIHDEYGNAPDEALSVLDEAEEVVEKNDARLLNQRAKVLFRLSRDREALELFERALESGALLNVEQMFAARSGGIAAARTGDWSRAEHLFFIGSRVAVQAEGMTRMAVGLLADAAFARWKQGKDIESLTLYSDVLKKLESIPIDNNLKNRYLHAVICHSLLWIGHTDDADGNKIAEPMPGVCSNQEPHEGFKELEIKGMPTIWGMLGSLDTKLGTGLQLAKMAKARCGGKLPLLMESSQRYSSYQALFKNINVASAIRVFVEMYESLQFIKTMEDKKLDGWATTEIPPLPADYWSFPDKSDDLLHRLLSVAITATCHNFSSPLSLNNWQNDLAVYGIKGQEVDQFFDIITGKVQPKADEFLQTAANCLYRLREQSLSPDDLFVVHFRLLNFLAQGEWGYYSGKPFANLLSQQWQYVANQQKFAFNSPKLYVPMLHEKCADTSLSGYSKAASILEVAASATSVRLATSGLQFLSQIKDRRK